MFKQSPVAPHVEANYTQMEKQKTFWRERFYSHKDSPKSQEQQKLIEGCLDSILSKDEYFENAIDFGCGKGRMITYLSERCGHVWAIDIIHELMPLAKSKALNCSTHILKHPLAFSGPKNQDLLFASLVFQHVTDEPLLAEIVQNVQLWLKPQAKIIILENAKDRTLYLKSRKPNVFVNAFGMSNWTVKNITLNKTDDHWLLCGTKI